ncbi:gliding motility-associated C-terminal domain-containing protein, partial [Lutibacter sp. HS1-25]|uniref:gliding motility-associated C-terminal domain-containing protein n=1 Tax=Lutibacter sp. HS1-25 TaxID=2485000 RepID=UPI0010257F6F
YATITNTAGCESVLRLEVTANIEKPLPPTGAATQTFCEIDNPTIENLSPSGNNINWYDSNSATTPLTKTAALVDGKVYYATITNTAGCESVLRLEVTANIEKPLPPTGAATQTFCVNDYLPNSPTIGDLSVTGTNVLWYNSETSTTALNSSDLLVNGQSYWASQTNAANCESALRLEVKATVISVPNAIVSEPNQTFCEAFNPKISDLQATGNVIVWYDSQTSTTPLSSTELLVDGENYWALNTDAIAGCESTSRVEVIASITTVPPPTIDESIQTFCQVNNPTVADLTPSTGIEWFNSETSTTPLNNTDLLVNGAVYWAAKTNSTGCISAVKIAVTVVLSNPGTPIIESSGEEFCIINNPTLAELDAKVSANNDGAISWYNSYPNGIELSLSELLIDGKTYYAIETDINGCSSVSHLEVTVDLNACDEYDIVVYDGFSPNGDGINDTFKIENLRELYPDFKVEFVNRWGNLMYSYDINKPDWNGRLKGDNDIAASGVYYYIIHFNKDNRKPIQGSLYLSR